MTAPARTRFTTDDLDALISLVRGGPVDEHRFTTSAVQDYLDERPEMTPAEAVVALLMEIRGA
jgi:hypothetical protein